MATSSGGSRSTGRRSGSRASATRKSSARKSTSRGKPAARRSSSARRAPSAGRGDKSVQAFREALESSRGALEGNLTLSRERIQEVVDDAVERGRAANLRLGGPAGGPAAAKQLAAAGFSLIVVPLALLFAAPARDVVRAVRGA